MKKVFFILCIIFTFCGCSQKDLSLNENALTETDGYDEYSSISAQHTYIATDEILEADLFDNKMQIGSSVITFPTPYQDIIDAGAINIDSTYSDSYLVDANGCIVVKMQIGSTQFSISAANSNSELTQLNKCDVVQLELEKADKADIFAPRGVSVGFSLEEITELLGEPYSIDSNDELIYHYWEYPIKVNRFKLFEEGMLSSKTISATNTSFTFTIDRNKNEVISFNSNELYYIPEENSYSRYAYVIPTDFKRPKPASDADFIMYRFKVIKEENRKEVIAFKNPSFSYSKGDYLNLSEAELINDANTRFSERMQETEVISISNNKSCVIGLISDNKLIKSEMVVYVDNKSLFTFDFNVISLDNNDLNSASLSDLKAVMLEIADTVEFY